MKTINNEYIRKLGPCYDPSKFVKDEESFTVLDIIDHKDVSFHDKLWIILRTDFVSERIMRLFAVWCYRQTLSFIKDPDVRSVEAANTAEKYANGEATQEELDAARSAAEAAMSAAMSAANTAAWSAESATWYAESAARSARSAAEAARSAMSAANTAARSAESAAWYAARSARSAVESAAWYARADASYARADAISAQLYKLRDILINGIETGDTY